MQKAKSTAELAAADQQPDGVSRESLSGDIVSVARAGDNDNEGRRFEPTKHWRFFAGTD